jgi:hypothetical protein
MAHYPPLEVPEPKPLPDSEFCLFAFFRFDLELDPNGPISPGVDPKRVNWQVKIGGDLAPKNESMLNVRDSGMVEQLRPLEAIHPNPIDIPSMKTDHVVGREWYSSQQSVTSSFQARRNRYG